MAGRCCRPTNCGFGNFDCGALPQSAVYLKAGWIDYPRHKTAIERRCPLWPDTIQSLREPLEKRPKPTDPADTGLCFITRHGNRWAHSDKADSPVSKQFRKLLDDPGLHRRGIGFCTLRHVSQTIAGDARDPDAVRAIMGHVDGTMSGEYPDDLSYARWALV